MSYITKNKTTMVKKERNKITINKDLFAFASTFNDVYFANDLNWKKIAIHFKHATSNQKKIIVMMNESSEGWFEASEMARTGTWRIEQIQVFDKDGDMTSVPRLDMPNPSSFDIVTELKISPSELIVSFSNSNTFTLGTGKGELYGIGYKIKVWDDVANNYHNQTVYTITAINGDVITVNYDITNRTGKTLRLKFPEFKNSDSSQRSMYQYVGSNWGSAVVPDAIILPPVETAPNAITGFSATQIGNSKVLLQWDKPLVTDILAYSAIIINSSNSNELNFLIDVTPTNDGSKYSLEIGPYIPLYPNSIANLSVLSPLSTYNFNIHGQLTTGQVNSNIIPVTITPMAPDMVEGLTATQTGQNEITLQWDNSGDTSITGFDVWLKADSPFAADSGIRLPIAAVGSVLGSALVAPPNITLSGNTYSLIISTYLHENRSVEQGIYPGNPYTFDVAASNSYGISENSLPVIVNTVNTILSFEFLSNNMLISPDGAVSAYIASSTNRQIAIDSASVSSDTYELNFTLFNNDLTMGGGATHIEVGMSSLSNAISTNNFYSIRWQADPGAPQVTQLVKYLPAPNGLTVTLGSYAAASWAVIKIKRTSASQFDVYVNGTFLTTINQIRFNTEYPFIRISHPAVSLVQATKLV